eukprot:13534327-Alexandrium_andersonii.AAC.1
MLPPLPALAGARADMEAERQRRAAAARFSRFVNRVVAHVRAGHAGGHSLRLVMAVALPAQSLTRIWRCDACRWQNARIGPFKRARCGGHTDLGARTWATWN